MAQRTRVSATASAARNGAALSLPRPWSQLAATIQAARPEWSAERPLCCIPTAALSCPESGAACVVSNLTVKAYLGCSRATAFRKIKAGFRIPKEAQWQK
jgi:hypothetical protein